MLASDAAAASPAEQGELFASWYAPLRSTLMILSKIYRAVDIIVFEDLAQQVTLAVSRADYFARWGISFLRMLAL